MIQELRLQENRGIIMILYLLIRKVTRLATSSYQKIPEVMRLMSVFSGAGASKESPIASSSIGWTIKTSASEGEPDIPPATAKVSSMELGGISATVGGVLRETVTEVVEAVSPLGNTLISCKQFSPDIYYVLFSTKSFF